MEKKQDLPSYYVESGMTQVNILGNCMISLIFFIFISAYHSHTTRCKIMNKIKNIVTL